MLLPVGLLAGAGFYFTGSRKPAPLARYFGPARLVVDRVEAVPATPLDVYKGYDTRIEIEAHVEGRSKLPRNAPSLQSGIGGGTRKERFVLADKHGSKVLRPVLPAELQHIVRARDRENFNPTLLLKTQNLPVTSQELQLHADLEFDRYHYPAGNRRLQQHERLMTPIAIRLREPGRKIPLPRPDHNSGIKLVDTHLQSVSPATSHNGVDTEIEIEIEHTGPKNSQYRSLSVIDTPYLQDAQGRKYSVFKFLDRSVSPPRPFTGSMNPGYSSGDDKSNIYLGMPLNQIPGKARPLTLHVKISADQRWPLHVSTVVRP